MSHGFTRIDYPRPEPASDVFIRRVLDNFLQISTTTAPPRKGDRVKVTLTGYIGSTDGHGFTLVDKRTPFGEDAEVVGGGPFEHPNVTVRVVERRPVAPKVGDTISGRLLKDTPWKRGTVVSVSTYTDAKYALGIDGKWTNVNSGTRCEFADFSNDGRYVIEHAPGKDTR